MAATLSCQRYGQLASCRQLARAGHLAIASICCVCAPGHTQGARREWRQRRAMCRRRLRYRVANLASQMRVAFSSIASKTCSSSPGDLLIIFSISEVADSCSNASSRSRFRRSNCSGEWSVDRCAVGVLRALDLTALWPRPLTGWPIALPRCFMTRPPGRFTMSLNFINFQRSRYVRFGSKADMCNANRHVRFTPNSGHVQCTSPCLLCANSGHSAIHSITSSALVSSDGGTVRPRVFAVLRLIASSNFTVCWMGKSAGFSPFRIRPA